MTSFTLDHHNRAALSDLMTDEVWVVACLCAAWCGSCRDYRAIFDALAEQHSDKKFIWIDIEDQAEVVGDFDVDDFPTLLLQRGDTVAFFGTVLPSLSVAERLLTARATTRDEDLSGAIPTNAEYKAWQVNNNLRRVIKEIL